jgi:hypothetical protein
VKNIIAGREPRFPVTPTATCAFPMWETMWISVNTPTDKRSEMAAPDRPARTGLEDQPGGGPAPPRPLLGGGDVDGDDRLDVLHETDPNLVGADRFDRFG